MLNLVNFLINLASFARCAAMDYLEAHNAQHDDPAVGAAWLAGESEQALASPSSNRFMVEYLTNASAYLEMEESA